MRSFFLSWRSGENWENVEWIVSGPVEVGYTIRQWCQQRLGISEVSVMEILLIKVDLTLTRVKNNK